MALVIRSESLKLMTAGLLFPPLLIPPLIQKNKKIMITEDEGISDTYNQMDEEMEDGEFVPDTGANPPENGNLNRMTGNVHLGGTQSSHGDSSPHDVPFNAEASPINCHSGSSNTSPRDRIEVIPLPDAQPTIPIQPTFLSQPIGVAQFPISFGPSASPAFIPGPSDSIRRNQKNSRRTGSSTMAPTQIIIPPPRTNLRSLDVNHSADSSTTSCNSGKSISSPAYASCASSSDLGRTIEMGNLVGFQFEPGHAPLLGSLTGEGVKVFPH
ncbi:hypothetical protein LXL04_006999 [Taraxacum kok-saghyz]